MNRSPLNFIRLIRIKKAARLLKQKNGNISEVDIEVGYTNPSYFARCFKKNFGVCPHVYQNNICKSVHSQTNYSKLEIFS
jgi:YesN/AraC family two-component response regulator